MMLAKSLQSAAGNAAGAANYIEDVFSTWLYTGNGSTQTITNGIDLAGEGGMVWLKGRDVASNNTIADTTRGTGSYIYSNTTDAADTGVTSFITAFNATGFSLGSGSGVNQSTKLYTSWTFRKQPKFFDVVTGTANSSGNVSFNHSLGTAPGFVIIKSTTNASTWTCYHQSLGPDKLIQLNSTNAAQNVSGFFTSTATTFSANTGFGAGAVGFVAYLFAHDSGGFGLSGTDNVISCGSFTTDGSGLATVNLGYEPQWVLVRSSQFADNWVLLDSMRGFSMTADARLIANSSGAEATITNYRPTSTGFEAVANLYTSATYIYIAIRRGPMRTPTSGTSVFAPVAYTGDGSNITTTPGFSPDLITTARRSAGGATFIDRLRGWSVRLFPYNTSADADRGASDPFFVETGPVNIVARPYNETGASGIDYVQYAFRRAPGFFDEVCYTGTGVARTVTHNLTVAPELMIVKSRSNGSEGWRVWHPAIAAINSGYVTELNGTDSVLNSPDTFDSTAPTSTVFTVGDNPSSNGSGSTYAAYLFASVAGVSKVGSYTGTGTTQTINCGFSAGARFVLIKRISSGGGGWYVWDSARGIVAGNDPYLLLNSTAAEVTNTDYIDTYSAGFEITSTAPAAINASGGTFIFFAVA